MNKSKEENNQDIKPVRSEVVSNRVQRRIKGGSLLLSSTITIINTIGLIKSSPLGDLLEVPIRFITSVF